MDAQGIVEELIDDVAYGCYARCLSTLPATRTYAGVVVCPACGNEIEHQWKREGPLIRARCGWHTLLATYAKAFLSNNLHGGSAMEVWAYYVEYFPAAQNLRESPIDRLADPTGTPEHPLGGRPTDRRFPSRGAGFTRQAGLRR